MKELSERERRGREGKMCQREKEYKMKEEERPFVTEEAA
jgi:hypothetical protein